MCGQVSLKCIWQSFKIHLIIGNACQHLELWIEVSRLTDATNIPGAFCSIETGHSLNQIIPQSSLFCSLFPISGCFFKNDHIQNCEQVAQIKTPVRALAGAQEGKGNTNGMNSSPGWMLLQVLGSLFPWQGCRVIDFVLSTHNLVENCPFSFHL